MSLRKKTNNALASHFVDYLPILLEESAQYEPQQETVVALSGSLKKKSTAA